MKRRWWVPALAPTLLALGGLAAWAQEPAGPQPLTATCGDAGTASCDVAPHVINGTNVSASRQKQLGLITVGNRCSGTLLNRFWVLTADHCVTTDGLAGGPLDALENLAVTASWSTRTIVPTKVVRYSGSAALDVALLFLGAGDFGPVRTQLLYPDTVLVGDPIATYGRGISAYAYIDSSGKPRPTSGSGRYREATLFVSSVFDTGYTMPVNALNQINGGGDSGGAAHLLSSLGASVGIVGVTSRCNIASRLPGMPDTPTWRWVTSISDCTHAPLAPIRASITRVIREGVRPCPGVSAGCATPESTALTLMLP